MSSFTCRSIAVALGVIAPLMGGCSCATPGGSDGGNAEGGETRRWVGVDADARTGCAVRDDGLAMCWGLGWGAGRVLPTRLASIHASSEVRACGLDADGAIRCFYSDIGPGPLPDNWSPPPGRFAFLTITLGQACAVDLAGVPNCWSYDQPSATNPVFPPPTSEPFAQLAIYGAACGVTSSQTGLCWTPFYDGAPQPAPVPPGTYRSIEPDGTGVCGLRTDGEVSCWSDSAEWLSVMGTPPVGPFVELAVGIPTCALRASGEAVCWGQRWLTSAPPGPLAPLQPTEERYEHIATGGGFFCGILLSGALSCWGDNDVGQTDPPTP